jgi:ribosomal protein L37AE/L43A
MENWIDAWCFRCGRRLRGFWRDDRGIWRCATCRKLATISVAQDLETQWRAKQETGVSR